MIPVFGPGVVYDVSDQKMASQLSMVKHGLSEDMLRGHPIRMQREIKALKRGLVLRLVGFMVRQSGVQDGKTEPDPHPHIDSTCP